MNYKTLITTAFFVLCTSGFAHAETQVLNLQTASAKTTSCGDFALESITLNSTPSNGAAAGAISVTNEAGQQVAARKVDAGQAGSVVAKVQPLGEEKIEDLALQLITRDADGNINVIETVQTNADGEATFVSALPKGEYQIALSCGAVAAAGLASSTAGVVALGATGITAIAVGASSNSGGSSSVAAEAATVNPRVNADDEPEVQSLSSASAS